MISAPPLAVRVFRSELVRASLILLALLNIAFSPALWGNRTLMTSAGETASLYITGARPSASPGLIVRTPDPGAPGWQFEPAMAFNGVEMFRHFRLPRWNPYAGYGSPWAAGMMPQPVFPLALFRKLSLGRGRLPGSLSCGCLSPVYSRFCSCASLSRSPRALLRRSHLC